MNNETILFPHSGDVTEAHSWVTLEGERFCLGVLATCKYCIVRETLTFARQRDEEKRVLLGVDGGHLTHALDTLMKR